MISEDTKIGAGTKIWHPELVNIYGAVIGENCNIGAFVEIRSGVIIGNRVRIQAMAFSSVSVVSNALLMKRYKPKTI